MLHYLKLYEQVIDTVWPFNTGQEKKKKKEKKKSRWDVANGERDRLLEVEITIHQGK